MDSSITVGQVAGAIATAIFVLQLFVPTALALILTGTIREDNTLVTWSVVARTIHGSYWPILLRNDSAATSGVKRSANIIVWLRPFFLAIIAIAAIITPLGLYDQVVRNSNSQLVPFRYAADSSPMGYGTSQVTLLGFNRWCTAPGQTVSDGVQTPCPGSPQSPNNGSLIFISSTGYDYTIPESLIDRFTAGLSEQDDSVSSVFDIQWRNFLEPHVSDDEEESDERFAVSQFRPLVSTVLDDDITAVHGLVVDTRDGGIGFRNHSVPEFSTHGTAWTEDLLFAEPDTVCVDTNLTIDFEIHASFFSIGQIESAVITDRGGFSNLNQVNPNAELANTSSVWDLDLRDRAYRGAWLNNYLTMLFMNITDPDFDYLNTAEGDEFYVNPTASTSYINTDVLKTVMAYGAYIDNLPTMMFNGSLNEPLPNRDNRTNYENPHGVSETDFTHALQACTGASRDNLIDDASVAVTCGMLFGAPRNPDDQQKTIFSPGDMVSIPMYSCASATRVMLKTVEFRYNGTGSLEGLEVASLRDKRYRSDNDRPYWGVEKTHLPGGVAAPLWGLVAKGAESNDDISVRQQESLRLPGYQDAARVGSSNANSARQNLAGVDFHAAAFSVAYNIDPLSQVQDYSGRRGLSMFRRWQELSWSEEDAAKIINLVWTDVAANAVHGSRGWVSSGSIFADKNRYPETAEYSSVTSLSSADHDAYTSQTLVRYRWPYAIPAFMALFVTICTALVAFALLCLGRATPSRMRWALNSTSVGRIYGTVLYPHNPSVHSPTRDWLDRVGLSRFRVYGPKETTGVEDNTRSANVGVGSEQLLPQQHQSETETKHPDQSETRVTPTP